MKVYGLFRSELEVQACIVLEFVLSGSEPDIDEDDMDIELDENSTEPVTPTETPPAAEMTVDG